MNIVITNKQDKAISSCEFMKNKDKNTLHVKNLDSSLKFFISIDKCNKYDIEFFRISGAKLLHDLKKYEINKAQIIIPTFDEISEEDICKGLSEGMILANYKFDKYKSKPKKCIVDSITLVVSKENECKKVVEETILICDTIYLVRDLVNTPPSDLNPTKYLEFIKNDLKKSKIKLAVLDDKDLKKQGLNCLRSVSFGSSESSVLVELEYKPAKPINKAPIAFIGKGITYDSGGINLKPSSGGFIESMKDDMAGSATVYGIIKLVEILKLPIHVVSVLAIAENMIGQSAYKPGDVLKAYNGKTVEVINTDAEGRLALADAMSFTADKYKPETIIDIATLTGASIMTTGWDITPFLSNNDQLSDDLNHSSKRTEEKIWRMPLDDCYKKYIKGDISDLKNIHDGMNAGVLTSSIFLNEFVPKNVKWAHFDIGGTVVSKRQSEYEPKGATGVLLRLMIDYLKNNYN